MKVFVPFSRVPDLGVEYVRRFRDVEIQYKILQFITPLYEQAKVEERRQTPSVIVLDKAYPAERKAKPKASLWSGLAFIGSLLLSLVGVFLLEMFHQLQNSHPERINVFLAAVTKDWFGLRFQRSGKS